MREELAYKIRAAGNRYPANVGDQNILCMPNHPEYDNYAAGDECKELVLSMEWNSL